ncbi:autotransporter outer membrane beta-barrel domain-containing protein [Paracoccus sp. Z330]|uniref:Autotransporter outer membrane beta-barrel domain-containing protein n=1 Tax=Paracoccus onchidii TaxID=3017813 RepID=A0ABT4ZAI6_9RHOB|nr:autotransporter outer membrane beta-barrel domain-containing protein [Paracoccus onchidii]MDB6176376.1 autotransporter outer membrane beta-barrel domain-containing protein [Paracoccus onchidii]
MSVSFISVPRASRIREYARASLVGTGMIIITALAPPRAHALEIGNELSFSVERQAKGVLSMMGISAIPDSTSSSLQLRGNIARGSRAEFGSSQLSGGFTFSDDFPLYLEGSIGYNRYNPDLLLTEEGESARLRPKWTGIAATGGIGWDFKLTETLKIRPILNLTYGKVITDTQVVAQFIANHIGNEDARYLREGGLTVGGYGGSLALVYNQQWKNGAEADAVLRYTDIHLKPIGGDKDVIASADARSLALWSRWRQPNSLRAFDNPMRTVYEFSASWLAGDQGEILHTDWLAQIGVGLEVNTTKTKLPWITEGRVVLRYTMGENLNGYGIGLAVSF